MISKSFDQYLFDKYDTAKYKVMGYLRDKGFHACINPDIYGPDIVADRDFVRSYYEVEVKEGWIGEFLYPTMHIPGRKMKYVDGETWFAVCSGDLEQVAWIESTIAAQNIIQKDTMYTKAETFMEVPMDKVIIEALEVKAWQ